MMTMNRTLQINTPSLRHCLHCNLRVPDALDDVYCCHGCRAAHSLIQQWGLEQYYKLLPSESSSIARSETMRSDYTMFDSGDFQQGFIEAEGAAHTKAHFFLNGITCYACVWVCEQLARKIEPDAALSINLTTGEAVLSYPSQGRKLSHYMKSFEALGYAVTPNRRDKGKEQAQFERLGVAFFCLMNVMMLAIPEYLGTESLSPTFRLVFRTISAVLAGLSLSYCAWPFLKNAFTSLTRRTLHLDFPISLALIVGYGYSVNNLVRGAEHVYFDSMAAVIALLLTGRFFQTRALERIVREQSRFLEADVQFVRVRRGEDSSLIPLSQVEKGDLIRVLPGEIIPLRSDLVSVAGEINYALLKGENKIRAVQQGEEILGGAMNGPTPMDLVTMEAGADSFLFKLQAASRSLYQNKGHYLSLSEKMAKFFVLFTLTAATGIGLWLLPTSPDEAFRRFASVLLVACPCVFGFGAPMVISRAFQLGMSRGLLFRNQKALEGLAEIKDFYFDKTGTLTHEDGEISYLRWNSDALEELGLSMDLVLDLAANLDGFSQHHATRALSRWAKTSHDPKKITGIRDLTEVLGQGLSFHWNNHDITLGRPSFCLPSEDTDMGRRGWTLLVIDGREALRFTLDEELRQDAHDCLQQLSREGKTTYILSGDSAARVNRVGLALDIPIDRILSELSPEQKREHIAQRSSAMVGNGLNDALASSGSTIGIALTHASDAMKSASDLVFLDKGLRPLLLAIELSAEARRVMKRCFLLALLFNLVAMGLALSGYVTPAMAAVLMPVSSLTVFFASQKFHLQESA